MGRWHPARRGARWATALPWAAAVLMVIVLAVVWGWSSAAIRRDSDHRVEAAVTEARTLIDSELRRYTDLLRAGTALLAADPTVSEAGFTGFVAGFDLPHRYPGALALFTVARRGQALEVQRVSPVRVAEFRAGADLSGAPAPAAALTVAQLARSVALSGPTEGPQTGAAVLLAFAPTTSGGWLGIQIDGQRFLEGMVERAAVLGEVGIVDVTGGQVTPVAATALSGTRVARSTELPVFGRRWRLSYAPREVLLPAHQRIQPWLLLGAGACATGLAVVTLALQARSRRRALTMAASLARSEARRDRLLDASPVAIVEVDRAGLVVSENAAAARLLGHLPQQAVGGPCAITARRGGGPLAPLDLAGDLNGAALELDTPAGTRWVACYLADAAPDSGRLLLLADETERHHLEERLSQAQKMEALGLLAGRIAHDFNNLLTPIGGYLDLVLAGDDLSEEDRSMLAEGHRATRRAAALVGQLLTITRQHAGAVRTVDAAGALRSLEPLLTRIVDGRVRLRVRPGTGPATVAIDPTGLEQIVVNLVTNARDAAAPDGTVELTVAPVGAEVVLRVSDDGAGMDASIRKRIFEPFFTTRQHSGGTGLGLATVYAIVSKAGGSIAVTSEPGRGTAFEIRFPVAEAPAERPAEPVQAAPQPVVVPAERAVLLVEDEDPVRQLVGLVLERAGYRVFAAASAEEALELFAQRPEEIDLLLSDVRLPGRSGPELAAEIGARRADLPVVFLSGYTDGLVAAGSLPPGTVLLTKPFRVEELTRQVSEALADAR